MRVWLHRLLGWLRRQDFDDELDAEIRVHLEFAAAEYVRRGMSPLAARRAASLPSL